MKKKVTKKLAARKHKKELPQKRKPLPVKIHSTRKLFADIKSQIELSRKQVAVSVNQSLTHLNWNIGMLIHNHILDGNRASYGNEILATLSPKLTEEFGQGYTASSLNRMLKLYRAFPDKKILATLSPKLSWSHFVELITLDDEQKRFYYSKITILECRSVRQLRERIESMQFERTILSKKSQKLIKGDFMNLSSDTIEDPELIFRDPYLLDFLGLKETYSEKDLEDAILAQLQQFITELGTDFAFIARQKRIVIDGTDYKMDLLFYHRGLKCLVVIDLKLGKFRAADKGQMELYLRWLEKYEMREGENPPVGLILCSDKSDEHVELLILNQDRIKVAKYYTQLPSMKTFKSKLQKAAQIAKRNNVVNQKKK